MGIGASAGGLDAINELFDHLPPRNNISYVIIQHLSPDYKSLMDELLAKHTDIRITVAEDRMLVKPNHIYLIPNKKNLKLQRNRLRLDEKPTGPGPNYVIDVFLESLAREKGPLAIGIILSGTGSDGARGAEAIKRNRGLVLAQDPASAKFDGMPQSAIRTGCVDYVLSPRDMVDKILSHPHADQKLLPAASVPSVAAPTGDVLQQILDVVQRETTHNFSFYKPQTLERRIQKRMQSYNFATPEVYLQFLENHPEEAKQLSQEFLIGVTQFFRDKPAFEAIEEKVIPQIVEEKSPGSTIKVWVAACSTGEEAYTLAMLFSEYLEKNHKTVEVKIFATDMDAHALQIANKAQYPLRIADDVAARRLQRYFVAYDDYYLVHPDLRKMVIFARHNLLHDPPFSHTDLITCRNLLIYMKPELQKKILSNFHFSLNLNGFLMLGASESGAPLQPSMELLDKKWSIYRNNQLSRRYTPITFMRPDTKSPKTNLPAVASQNSGAGQAPRPRKTMEDAFAAAMMEEAGFAGIFVDERFDFVQALGDYKHYVVLPDKSFSRNLLNLLPEELSASLSVAMRKALRLHTKMTCPSIRAKYGTETRSVSMTVIPQPEADPTQGILLILFREEKSAVPDGLAQGEVTEMSRADMLHIAEIEAELKEAKENLQMTVEELETSNEELQSSNEELLSSNEELQSTNEELQSLNEELHSVNAELKEKIRELSELNDDLNNYFNSTDIGQIFVDQNMLIRKYTPAVAQLINIIDSDIGRSISHFSFNIKQGDALLPDIRRAMEERSVVEREVEVQNGRTYQMRIQPYVRKDSSVDGVVVTFVDITRLKQLNQILAGVMDSSLNGIAALECVENEDHEVVDFEWRLLNGAVGTMLGLEQGQLLNKRLRKTLPCFVEDGIFAKLIQVYQEGGSLHTEYHYRHHDTDAWLELVAVQMNRGIALTLNEITQKKKAEEELLDAYREAKEARERLVFLNNELESRVAKRTRELSVSEERFRLMSLATNDAVWDWNMVNNELWWNESFQEKFGEAGQGELATIQEWYSKVHDADRARVMKEINQVINEGYENWTSEYRFRLAEGSYAFVYSRAYLLKDEQGIPYRMLGSLTDVTDLKQVQEELKQSNEKLIRINTDLDNFVYTASHDLKAPIANLEGLMRMLHNKIRTKVSDDDMRLLSMTDRSVMQLKNTIHSLAEVIRVQKDMDENVEQVRFDEILDDVRSDLSDFLHSTHAELHTHFQVEQLYYTRVNLRSVLYNLLSNSLKYRHPERMPDIRVTTEVVDDYVLLSVEDNGLGMTPAQLKKLFTMFRRFHTHVDGTGVGLHMIKRIVENRGGKIEVDSTVQEGTTFRIYLKELTPTQHGLPDEDDAL